MSSSLDLKRELLRHLLAAVTFRCGIVIRDAPENFAHFRAGDSTRSAGELLAHIGDLIEGSHYLMEGEFVRLQSSPQSWAEDAKRFFIAIREFDSYLASDAPLAHPVERIVQAPVADALTHVGQIAMLRRLAGKPIQSENFFDAEIEAGGVIEKYFSNFI